MKDISTGLTAQEVAMLQGSIDAMDAVISRFAINFTEKQRSAVPAMAKNRLAFSNKSYGHAETFRDLMGGRRKFADFMRIRQDWLWMDALLRRLNTLRQKLDDTTLQISANYYTYALAFYNRAKEAQEDEVPGITSALAELSEQFEAQRGNRNGNEGSGTDGNSTDQPKDGGNGGANPGPIPGNEPVA
ncbi:MAG: hypothetical protein U0176_04985 [Bacteroidia bacterium]